VDDRQRPHGIVDDPFASRCPTYFELLQSLSTLAAQYNVLMLDERENRGIETCTTQ
jgi:hypothetical protein